MSRSRRTPRILVVHDDPGLLRLLTIRLRAQKYEVEPAGSAADALAAGTGFRPDLVITDLRMAQMDGIALLRELQRRWPGLNVIMLTAHGTIPDAVRATQSGAFAFLTKPVEKDQLLDEVRRASRPPASPTARSTTGARTSSPAARCSRTDSHARMWSRAPRPRCSSPASRAPARNCWPGRPRQDRMRVQQHLRCPSHMDQTARRVQ